MGFELSYTWSFRGDPAATGRSTSPIPAMEALTDSYVATAIGAIGGAAVGANVSRGTQVYTQDVQRCAAVPGSARPEYWDVTYVFRGVYHRAQLGFAPGATITVNERGEPRV